jgi:hypothetical protein
VHSYFSKDQPEQAVHEVRDVDRLIYRLAAGVESLTAVAWSVTCLGKGWLCLVFCCLQLVERRVRNSLQLIQRGELTASQALRAVVNCLADELTDHQYQCLVCYFKLKQAKGQLAPAKQLLLQQLYNAKGGLPATAAGARDQAQQAAALTYHSHSLPSPASTAALNVGLTVDAAKGSAADQLVWRGTTAGVCEPAAVKQQSQQQQQQQVQQIFWAAKPTAAWGSSRLQVDV